MKELELLFYVIAGYSGTRYRSIALDGTPSSGNYNSTERKSGDRKRTREFFRESTKRCSNTLRREWQSLLVEV